MFKIQLFCSESNQKPLYTFSAWSIIYFFEIYSFTQKRFFYETRDSFPILADTHCNSFDALFLLHHPVWKSYERRRRTFDRKCLIKNFKLGHSFSCQKIPQIYLVSILMKHLGAKSLSFLCKRWVMSYQSGWLFKHWFQVLIPPP